MNSIKITIPKGFKTTDINEYSIGEEHTVEIGLIDEKDMCKNHLVHDADSCGKCSRAEKIKKGAKKFAKDFEGVMEELSRE